MVIIRLKVLCSAVALRIWHFSAKNLCRSLIKIYVEHFCMPNGVTSLTYFLLMKGDWADFTLIDSVIWKLSGRLKRYWERPLTLFLYNSLSSSQWLWQNSYGCYSVIIRAHLSTVTTSNDSHEQTQRVKKHLEIASFNPENCPQFKEKFHKLFNCHDTYIQYRWCVLHCVSWRLCAVVFKRCIASKTHQYKW